MSEDNYNTEKEDMRLDLEDKGKKDGHSLPASKGIIIGAVIVIIAVVIAVKALASSGDTEKLKGMIFKVQQETQALKNITQ